MLQKSYLWVASDTGAVGGTPQGVKRISVGTEVGSLSRPLRNPEEPGVNSKLMSLHYQCKSKATPTAVGFPRTHNGVPDSRCPVHEASLQPALPRSCCHGARQQFVFLASSSKQAVLLIASCVMASPAPALGSAPVCPLGAGQGVASTVTREIKKV